MADDANTPPDAPVSQLTTAQLQDELMRRRMEENQTALAAAQAVYADIAPIFSDAKAFTFTDMLNLIQGFQASDRPRLPDTDMPLDTLARAMVAAQRLVLKKIGPIT